MQIANFEFQTVRRKEQSTEKNKPKASTLRQQREAASRTGRDGVRDVSNGVPRHSGRSRQDREGEMVLEENGRSQGQARRGTP
ncbi:MAG: hypothetical protein WB723_14130, partial [Candidatus Acidiferrales bacterium]